MLLASQVPYRITIATLIFLTAVLTDWLDGLLARRTGTVSPFGAIMDPLTDKILVLLYFAYLQNSGFYPLWLFLAVLARDLFHGSYRSFAASMRVVIGANAASKWKTSLQMCSILLMLFLSSYAETTGNAWPEEELFRILANVAMIAALIIGIIGTTQFIVQSRHLLTTGE